MQSRHVVAQDKRAGAVRTVYLPNENADTLKLVIHSLRTQLDEQVRPVDSLLTISALTGLHRASSQKSGIRLCCKTARFGKTNIA